MLQATFNVLKTGIIARANHDLVLVVDQHVQTTINRIGDVLALMRFAQKVSMPAGQFANAILVQLGYLSSSQRRKPRRPDAGSVNGGVGATPAALP
jgi:hypothetical protein